MNREKKAFDVSYRKRRVKKASIKKNKRNVNQPSSSAEDPH